MTIIQPNKSKETRYWALIITTLAASSLGLVLYVASLYSKTVDLKHNIAGVEENIQKDRVINAEIKSQLFKMTDPELLSDAAKQKGLIEDKNPKWVFASLSSL